jgi:hypothetical protein
MKKDHLRFVLDNWLLMYVALPNFHNLEYIIAALSVDGDHNEDFSIDDTREELEKLRNLASNSFMRSKVQITDTHKMVSDIQMAQSTN